MSLPPSPFEADLGLRRWSETHLGEVVSVDDPDRRARVQVRLYTTDGPEGQDAPVWCRVAQAVAGRNRGTFLLPDVGDEVLVTFVGGDSRHPVVIGSLFNGRDTPTESLSGDDVDVWSFKSKDGTTLTVVESDRPTVRIALPSGITAELTDAGAGKVELDVHGTTVTLEPTGVTVQTGGRVSVSGSTVDVSAASVTVDAAVARFSGVVTCTTIQATTVIGTTYTPGAGNIW